MMQNMGGPSTWGSEEERQRRGSGGCGTSMDGWTGGLLEVVVIVALSSLQLQLIGRVNGQWVEERNEGLRREWTYAFM